MTALVYKKWHHMYIKLLLKDEYKSWLEEGT